MCGIVAAATLTQITLPLTEAQLIQMNDLQTHRGPDEQGTRLADWYALGSRRLSIIDLAGGKQPIPNEDESIWIAFNGEIFNYQSLRSELLDLGHIFRTNSDTEVIVHGYEEWGTDVAKRLRGQFAFAIADQRRNRFFVARDHLGIKPLFYTLVDGALVVASEIKALLAYPGVKAAPYLPAVLRYLHFRYAMGEETLFEGIASLPAGHHILVEDNTLSINPYWQIPIIPDKEDKGEAYYLKEVAERVRESVELRMISEVPIGAYLSGGLDSSIVVAAMSELSDHPVKTFTIGFETDGYNEYEYAREVADMHKTEHREIKLSAVDYLGEMERLIRFKDAPLSVPNEVPLHVMSRELRQYITVVLSGEGADELFGGYGRIFRSPFDYQRMQLMKSDPDLLAPPVKELLCEAFTNKYGQCDFDSPFDHFLSSYYYTGPSEIQQLLNPEFVTSATAADDPLKYLRAGLEKVSSLDHSSQYMWLFQQFHLEGLLRRVDMTTMATSVEARVPFVDHKLVEFVTSIPVDYKMRWRSELHRSMAAVSNADAISEQYDITKYILRTAFAPVLPERIVTRRKVGFPVPLHHWFGGDYQDQARDILLDPSLTKWGLFNRHGIEQQLAILRDGGSSRQGIQIWMLMNLALWLNAYFE